MQTFTGWQYLLIDVANHGGKDKLAFEERIQWATENLDNLEAIADAGEWKERPQFIAATMAIRDAQAGVASGYMVGFDAVCSGMQLMSVLTGCKEGATATGLVDKYRRADAYTDCTKIMGQILGREWAVQRSSVKNAVMTCLYGSKKEPQKEFGVGTRELYAFYQAMYKLCPGACELLDALLESWNAYALVHQWKLPDGYDARVKVMQKVETQIEVDELNHHTFTYTYYENEGERRGVKNAANVIHSIDAYVLRSLVRRCNYDAYQAHYAIQSIQGYLIQRTMDGYDHQEILDIVGEPSAQLSYYIAQYERSGMADIVILPYLDQCSVVHMSSQHLRALNQILDSMLEHKPFPIVTIHDEFKCHPNNMNYLRMHYRDILVELAESNVLDDILSQLYGYKGNFPMRSRDLAQTIRNSNYALC